jgi:hypothetical protein
MRTFRTQMGKVEQFGADGKWRVSFDMFKGVAGSETLYSTFRSAAVFDTEDEAYEGGKRALDELESTGMFPNMCEKF